MDKRKEAIRLKPAEGEKKVKNIEGFITHRTIIKVLGIGGAGGNTLTRLADYQIKEIESIAINTDAQDLLCSQAQNKLLIGQNITNGLGAGSNPKIGEEAAAESKDKIKQLLEGSDLVFLTCGMGGGTGTGATPIVSEIARSISALTIAIVTLPFKEEGQLRYKNAVEGLEKLRKSADTVIVISNDRLMDIVPELPLNEAFKKADELLLNAVKCITELVSEKGLVNLDFADIKTIMKDGEAAMIGIGESNSENRAIEAVEKAIINPLLDVNIEGARSALIQVSGDENMTLTEARTVMQTISAKLDPQAKITWGARIDRELKGSLRVLIIATGLKTPSHQLKAKSSILAEKQGLEIKKISEPKLFVDKQASNDGKKKTQKVFTEIFVEEIRGDLNILKESVKNFDQEPFDEKVTRHFIKACSSLQSSAQLFEYDKINEFITFVIDIVETSMSRGQDALKLVMPSFQRIPFIIEGMVANNLKTLEEADKLVQKVSEIMDQNGGMAPEKSLNKDMINLDDHQN